ncbi:MAG: hypothetical protein QW273_01550 [Candidatus Pacearchaeota archaeon]
MAYSITNALNKLNELGVFSYVLPFMIIFALVFGLLQKTKILGDKDVKGINAVIAAGIAGISLMFDTVPTFFSVIFPKFGVGLAIFLVLLIMLGFFYSDGKGNFSSLKWVGWVIGIGVLLWTLNEWDWFGSFQGSFGVFLEDYLPLIILVLLIIFGINLVVKGGSSSEGDNKKD